MAESLTFTTSSSIKYADNLALQSKSNKKTPLVLIHGWGLNSGVWQPLIEKFLRNEVNANDNELEIITIDLPGFGKNHHVNITPYSLTNICRHIAEKIDRPAVYLGWSLGGLVATKMALSYPEKVLGLITVASSPHFVENINKEISSRETAGNFNDWPGIKQNILINFHQQLSEDIEKTLRNFLKIQAMGSPHIRQDLKEITKLVMQHKLPSQQTLANSLQLLSSSDLRLQLTNVKQPFLRLYGANDSLVPTSIIPLVNKLAINSEQHIFNAASHAPFISHADDFYQVLSKWLTKYISH
jgi:pimeloyl-[acyl-carrier protein] methyl ester esterase